MLCFKIVFFDDKVYYGFDFFVGFGVGEYEWVGFVYFCCVLVYDV